MAPTKTAKKAATNTKTSGGFTAEERAAMKARAQEAKAQASRAEGEKTCLGAIAAMPGPDRALGKKLHRIITSSAPELAPKTWYGMPAYARDDKVVCFFKPASKFNARYATLGFNDAANLDDGTMWPTEFAVTKLTAADEAKIAKLVKKAVS
jgi:uncharacterized protein YdhG (YjbR/CyaY superfamily)